MNTMHGSQILENNIKRIHFIGLGGVGMSGIAEILINLGYQVSGSDISENKYVKHLVKLGANFFLGHHPDHIQNVDLVVVSSAISPENPEVRAALEKNLLIIPRAQMLSEIMCPKTGIAIAGTHGKTTTSGLVASILMENKLDPSFVIGGTLYSVNTNAKFGKGDYFVVEADESDASLVFLNPKIAIITNIDADHLWFFNDDFERLKRVFIQFLQQLPEDGYAIICIDDPVICELLPQLRQQVKTNFITYGFNAKAGWQLSNFKQQGIQSEFEVINKGTKYQFKLNLPGEHNALNATAAIIVGVLTKIPQTVINKSLSEFKGTGRRFQIKGEYRFARGQALIIDDYGHHPREIAATIKAAKSAWPEKRLVLVFQPQRYSRTKALFNDFAKVLAEIDHLILLDIYPAGEEPIAEITATALLAAIQKQGAKQALLLTKDQRIEDMFDKVLEEGDVVLMQGAGDIGAMVGRLFDLHGKK